MRTITKNEVVIEIGEEELIEAIAELKDFKDYLDEEYEGKEFTKDVNVAIETMEAFWCEHFGGSEDGEQDE